MRNDWSSAKFLEAVELIYETTPYSDRGLRDYIVTLAVKKGQDILKQDENGLFAAMTSELSEFGKDMIEKLLAGSKADGENYECYECNVRFTITADEIRDIYCPKCTIRTSSGWWKSSSGWKWPDSD
jgi:hypothetical protein